jgi:16S rRNA pseudouridine516 synthase
MGRLVKYLANLGYGSRREVARLLAERRVRDTEGHPLTDDAAFTHASVHVDDAPLDPAPGSVIALHKPLGYVCSTTDASNPVVYDLLPPFFATARRSWPPSAAWIGIPRDCCCSPTMARSITV